MIKSLSNIRKSSFDIHKFFNTNENKDILYFYKNINDINTNNNLIIIDNTSLRITYRIYDNFTLSICDTVNKKIYKLLSYNDNDYTFNENTIPDEFIIKADEKIICSLLDLTKAFYRNKENTIYYYILNNIDDKYTKNNLLNDLKITDIKIFYEDGRTEGGNNKKYIIYKNQKRLVRFNKNNKKYIIYNKKKILL